MPCPPPRSMCNDIAVGPDGTAYVADTFTPNVLSLKPGGTALDVFATDPMLAPGRRRRRARRHRVRRGRQPLRHAFHSGGAVPDRGEGRQGRRDHRAETVARARPQRWHAPLWRRFPAGRGRGHARQGHGQGRRGADRDAGGRLRRAGRRDGGRQHGLGRGRKIVIPVRRQQGQGAGPVRAQARRVAHREAVFEIAR